MSDDFFDKVGTETRPSLGRAGKDMPTTVEEEKRISLHGASRWAISDGTYWGVASSTDSLPSGFYGCGFSHHIGPYLESRVNDTDEIIDLHDSRASEILEEIKVFSNLKPEFTKRGFLYKRGILLWGPPGGGKTCTIQQLIQMVINKLDGIAIFIDQPNIASKCLQLIRKIERNRQIICLLEDLDALVMEYGENEYLSLLDGESQINDVIYVATTNYPEKLDKRFVDRPSRFDTIKFIGMPSTKARKQYISTKEPELSEIEVQKYVDRSKGFSVAHLRELIIMTQCFNKSFEESINKLESMIQRQPTSDDDPDRKTIGFRN